MLILVMAAGNKEAFNLEEFSSVKEWEYTKEAIDAGADQPMCIVTLRNGTTIRHEGDLASFNALLAATLNAMGQLEALLDLESKNVQVSTPNALSDEQRAAFPAEEPEAPEPVEPRTQPAPSWMSEQTNFVGLQDGPALAAVVTERGEGDDDGDYGDVHQR